jgi:hypothetical protein
MRSSSNTLILLFGYEVGPPLPGLRLSGETEAAPLAEAAAAGKAVAADIGVDVSAEEEKSRSKMERVKVSERASVHHCAVVVAQLAQLSSLPLRPLAVAAHGTPPRAAVAASRNMLRLHHRQRHPLPLLLLRRQCPPSQLLLQQQEEGKATRSEDTPGTPTGAARRCNCTPSLCSISPCLRLCGSVPGRALRAVQSAAELSSAQLSSGPLLRLRRRTKHGPDRASSQLTPLLSARVSAAPPPPCCSQPHPQPAALSCSDRRRRSAFCCLLVPAAEGSRRAEKNGAEDKTTRAHGQKDKATTKKTEEGGG